MAKPGTRTAQVSFRVTKEFKQQLEQQARKERRSVSNLVIMVMEEYLREKQKED